MKKISLLIGLLIFSIFHTQIRFESGYFIKNSGEKTEVLIKNLDWKNNPTEFEYKLQESSEIKKENIKNVKEFGVNNEIKYVRKTVMMDHSSENLSKMSEDRKPEFVEETLFLKYEIEGKASLLYYEDSDIKRFFYSVDNSEIKQLIYKMYYLNNVQMAYNEEYKKQISDALNCGITEKEINITKYRKDELIKLFTKYNECSSNGFTSYAPKKKKDLFNLTIRPGINSSSLTLENFADVESNTKFDSKIAFRIGAEFEFILPFNKNKWSVFVEPTYQYYKNSNEFIIGKGTYYEENIERSVDYKSIEIPIGVRHYFFLNEKSKLFVNGAFIVDASLNSTFKLGSYRTLDIASGLNFAFGGGYKYNDKLSIELRFHTDRSLLRDYELWTSNYKTISLIFGYTVF